MSTGLRVQIERKVLLYEIERRCGFTECNERVFIGLTKSEAFNYSKFECPMCNRWTKDALRQKDIPDWWLEISGDANSQTNTELP